MYILEGKPLSLDVPFSHGGTLYPANWLRLSSLQERNAIGITEQAGQDLTTKGSTGDTRLVEL